MNENEFAQTIIAVQALPFVDNVIVHSDMDIVLIELSPPLVAVLPAARQMFQVTKSELSVQEVIQLYNMYVVEYIDEVAELAHQMLRDAQHQVK